MLKHWKHLLVATFAIALLVTPFAGAVGEGDPILGGARNPDADQTQELTRETEIIAQTNTYGTRQSNKSNNGGGAIYGCRSGAGGTAAGNEPCLRGNNLSQGLAFEFAFRGPVGGRIDSRVSGDTRKPFTTNATGVATGLNADRVDGLDASQIAQAATRWVLVDPAGQIIRQTGGFTLVNCYQDNANCYIDAGEDVTNNAVHAEIVTSNNPDAGTDGQVTGDTSSSPCGFDFVNCSPAGTENNNVFVVTPRNSDGTAPAADDRYYFYAYVTGSQSG